MGLVSVGCTNVANLSFKMAEMAHLLGNYRAAVFAAANDDWTQVARHVMSQGGKYGVLSRNLRGEWSVQQKGDYRDVLDLIGHDNAPQKPIGKNAVERGGVAFFQWHEVMSREGFEGGQKPVVDVSWYHAKAFTLTAGGIYLLSDGEWEHAAEDVDPSSKVEGQKLVHCSVGSDETGTTNVGDKRPNKHGIYQMLGNVWEWTDENPAEKWKYGLRGGSWGDDGPGSLRAAFRFNGDPDFRNLGVGIRVGAPVAQDSK